MNLRNTLESHREDYRQFAAVQLRDLVETLFLLLNIEEDAGHNYAELISQSRSLLQIFKYCAAGERNIRKLDSGDFMNEQEYTTVIKSLEEIIAVECV